MKKVKLFLLAIMFAAFGSATMAQSFFAVNESQLTSAAEIVSGSKYAIRNLHLERGGLWYESGTNIKINSTPGKIVGEEYIFTINKSADGSFSIQAMSGKYLPAINYNANFELSPSPSTYLIKAYDGENQDVYNAPGTFSLIGNITGGRYVNANPGTLASWTNAHPTCIHTVEEITTVEPGEFYYITSDNAIDGDDVSYYLYDNNGELSLSKECKEGSKDYIWKCVKIENSYAFINGNGRYLAFRMLSPTPYTFTVNIINSVSSTSIPLYADAAQRYLTVKNDGSAFGYSMRINDKNVYDQSSDFKMIKAPAIDIPNLPKEEEKEVATWEVPQDGKRYYIYIDTYQNGNYIPRYFYNSNGTLTMSTTAGSSNEYIWTATKNSNGTYSFANAAGKYLGHKELASSKYEFTVDTENVYHQGVALKSVASDSRVLYFVVPNDGSKFDQSTITYDQTNTEYCTDFVFVPVDTEGYKLNIVCNASNAGRFEWNNKKGTSFSVKSNETVSDATLSLFEGNNAYKFLGFYSDANYQNSLGESVEIESLTENKTIYAKFELDIFSENYGDKWLRAVVSNNSGYAICLPKTDSYNNAVPKTQAMNVSDSSEEICLVGTYDSFKIFFKNSGNEYALTTGSTNYGDGTTTKLVAKENAISWHLIDKNNETAKGYCIAPVGNNNVGINPYAGVNKPIKLYYNSDPYNGWTFLPVGDTPLRLVVNIKGEPYQVNTKVGGIELSYGGNSATLNIGLDATENVYNVFEGTRVSLKNIPNSYRGYVFEGFEYGTEKGVTELNDIMVGKEGLTVTANFLVDESDKSQYLYYNGANGHPYRIPAIATAPNGDIFAISDNRPCGSDIGYGEVDIKCRISKDNGRTWGDEFFVANGEGNSASEVWKIGFGDAAVVADREKNELLIMMVCGNTVCWDGNYIPNSASSNPNRVARVRAKLNEATGEWEFTAPEHVTESIYPLFVKNGTATVQSLFIGSGRICQSRIVKRGDYYRLYCAVWTKNNGNRVIYSDDFGESWNILGTVDDRPAPSGDEPKCEELPNGDVILSSRKGGGRFFNVFSFSDIENSNNGSWGSAVASNEVGGLTVGSNSTNGEILHVYVTDNSTGEDAEIMLQSLPTGNDRSKVGIYWREINKDTYTPNEFAKEWKQALLVTTQGSAYSTMCIQKDGKIGFLYEEVPGGYCIVYEPISIETLTAGKYRIHINETAVEEITETHLPNANNAIYDLMGRKVSKPGKGIYIMNGKKFLK